jgi:undecaprenyl-diphosphatase
MNTLKRNISQRELMLITGLAILTIAISFWAWREPRFPGDLQLTLLMKSFGSIELLPPMEWISYLMGGWRAGLFVIISSIAVWYYLGKLEAGLVVLAGLTSLLNIPIKFLISRPRPAPTLVQVFALETNSSFPSGHAMFVILVFGFLAFLVIAHMQPGNRRVLIAAALIFIILLTGISRIYLGIHWPSDVLGGYLVGATLLAMLIYLYHNVRTV